MVPKTRTARCQLKPLYRNYGKGAILGLRTDLQHAKVINSLDQYWLRHTDTNLKTPSIVSVPSLTLARLQVL
eukprot:1487957-Rhodomonas_salina.1